MDPLAGEAVCMFIPEMGDAVQAHMGRLPLPISDYITDTKTALDNSLRVLQALCDAAGDAGYLSTALSTMALVQSLMQVTAAHSLSPLSMVL